MRLLSVNIGKAEPLANAEASGQTGIFKRPANGPMLAAYLASGDTPFGAPFAGSSSLSFTTPATRLTIGATTSSAAAAITVDDIVLDTGAMPSP